MIRAKIHEFGRCDKVSTTNKGDLLEDSFYEYLCALQSDGGFLFGVYPPERCLIYKKKKYYCTERQANVEFDVVVEVFREGGDKPHLYLVFECKNHGGAISERDITDHSDKLSRLFKHSAKGGVVVSSRLQSGAVNVATNRGMMIVKFDQHGIDIQADRTGDTHLEAKYVESQIFVAERHIKSLKFSAYFDGRFFSSVNQLLASVDSTLSNSAESDDKHISMSVPFVPDEDIRRLSEELLALVAYAGGPVSLSDVCATLGLNLTHTAELVRDADGKNILGSANFDKNIIQINHHQSKQRERFTIAHEIGHFYLGHGKYLRSETIVEQDLFVGIDARETFNFERLEFQANIFAANFLMPKSNFLQKTKEYRDSWGIVDKGHGFIFVDSQPCNQEIYNPFIMELSAHFDVSIKAAEIRLKELHLLTDQRNGSTRG